VESGGVYLNNNKVDGVAASATTSDLLFGKYLLLRKGKRSYAILRVN
jgi:tyrosyl-tRNA synthetase